MSTTGFTYKKPNEANYFKALTKILQSKGEEELATFLKGGGCFIEYSSQFSRKRWDAYYTTVYLRIPIEKFRVIKEDEKGKLVQICDSIMPRETGLDVMDVEFSPMLEESPQQPGRPVEPSLEIDRKKSQIVFVIHGRNGKARSELYAFFRAIGLSPLEWPQMTAATKSGSPYIGEILDKAFSVAHAAIALMTPDDLAHLRKEFRKPDDAAFETELTGQARPNVLFEAGMAMGRNPDRTVLVQLGVLRPFSDILGRHVIKLDNTLAKRQELANRLRAIECDVDLSGTDWHTAGDFEKALDDQRPRPLQQKTHGMKPAQAWKWVIETYPRKTLKQMAIHRRFLFPLKYEPVDRKKISINVKIPESVRKKVGGTSFVVEDFKVDTRGGEYRISCDLASLARKFKHEGAKASDKFTFEITYPT